MFKKSKICLLTLFVLFGFNLSQARTEKDLEGSKDHPMISRYEGAYISGYELNLGVAGHTDATGSEEHNMDLSKRRAEAVVEYLTSEQNISEDKLKPRGLGRWAPVAGNEDKDG
ncbi:MAG: OmpA family protein, partial [Prolixibacteraceae bacterium]